MVDFLGRCAENTLQEITRWCDLATLLRLCCVCRRFNQCSSAINFNINRYLAEAHGIPKVILTSDERRRRAALMRSINVSRFRNLKHPEYYVMEHVELPMEGPPELDRQLKIRGSCIVTNELYWIQVPIYHGGQSLQGDSCKSCAVVRDSKTMDFLGYLPSVPGFISHVYSHPKLGNFLLTATDDGIKMTHIERNLKRSLDEMMASSTDAKQILAVDENLNYWFVHFHRNWILFGVAGQASVYKLSEELLEAKDGNQQLSALATFHTPNHEKLKDGVIDCHLKIVTLFTPSGDFYVCRDLENLSNVVRVGNSLSLWPLNYPPAEYQLASFYQKDGFAVVFANSGMILVYRWNGNTFIPWRRYLDPSFPQFAGRMSNLRTVMDLQCGMLVTVVAPGSRVLVWDLMSEEQEPLVTLTEKEMFNRFLSNPSEVRWSFDLRQITLTVHPGLTVVFRPPKPQPKE